MSTAALDPVHRETENRWLDEARSLGPDFGVKASGYDTTGHFVADNYKALAEAKLFWAGIPTDLGGGGATHRELCDIILELGRHCGSTALAFAMHTHPVAANVFKHLKGDDKSTGALKKIAGNNLVIAGTGANDWLGSSGEAKRVEDGFRVTAHKRFVSGAPGAQLFVTSARYEGPDGPEVIHFATPFKTEGIEILDTWHALGMRGTGSHDVVLKDVFVPDASVVVRRPADVWHPMWNVIIPIAMPLIVSAYVGLAETAMELAKDVAKDKGAQLASSLGEMANTLATARMAREEMIRAVENYGFAPTLDLADDTLIRKSIVAEAVKATVELASEVVGGQGFSRGHPIERIVRDVRAMHFHPLPKRKQVELSGRVRLGLDPAA